VVRSLGPRHQPSRSGRDHKNALWNGAGKRCLKSRDVGLRGMRLSLRGLRPSMAVSGLGEFALVHWKVRSVQPSSSESQASHVSGFHSMAYSHTCPQ
jgi:hypothetical protein